MGDPEPEGTNRRDTIEPIDVVIEPIEGIRSGTATYEFDVGDDDALDERVRRQLPSHERLEWRGRDGQLEVYRLSVGGRTHFLRLLRVETTLDRDLMESFVDAVETWSRLDHEGIASVVDYETDPRPWFLVERPDTSLTDWIRSEDGPPEGTADTATGRIRPRLFRPVLDACDAVEFAHGRGVTHGRIRPEAIGLFDDRTVCVDDWGVTRAIGRASEPTPYTAPEQLREPSESHGAPDRRTDVYRLGAVAYTAVTGRPPFDVDRPVDLREAIVEKTPPKPSGIADVPEAFDDQLYRALSNDPEDRFETVVLFREALAEAGETP
jgi:serine/threonine-protein kinase